MTVFFSWWLEYRYAPNVEEEAPRWVYTTTGLSLLLYQILDVADGKQARKLVTRRRLASCSITFVMHWMWLLVHVRLCPRWGSKRCIGYWVSCCKVWRQRVLMLLFLLSVCLLLLLVELVSTAFSLHQPWCSSWRRGRSTIPVHWCFQWSMDPTKASGYVLNLRSFVDRWIDGGDAAKHPLSAAD